MTRSLSPRLDRLACVPVSVRDQPRYVGDHVIRHYRPRGLAALLADLGADSATPEFTIQGGIGTLTLHADGTETWDPVATIKAATPLPAPAALAQARLDACASCVDWVDAACKASGCGCAGEGKAATQSSICPLGRWPSLPSLSIDSR